MENEALGEKLNSREKQCANILLDAKTRILNTNEQLKHNQIEISCYKERILTLDRQNKG